MLEITKSPPMFEMTNKGTPQTTTTTTTTTVKTGAEDADNDSTTSSTDDASLVVAEPLAVVGSALRLLLRQSGEAAANAAIAKSMGEKKERAWVREKKSMGGGYKDKA
jgi:hypothetical protein